MSFKLPCVFRVIYSNRFFFFFAFWMVKMQLENPKVCLFEANKENIRLVPYDIWRYLTIILINGVSLRLGNCFVILLRFVAWHDKCLVCQRLEIYGHFRLRFRPIYSKTCQSEPILLRLSVLFYFLRVYLEGYMVVSSKFLRKPLLWRHFLLHTIICVKNTLLKQWKPSIYKLIETENLKLLEKNSLIRWICECIEFECHLVWIVEYEPWVYSSYLWRVM